MIPGIASSIAQSGMAAAMQRLDAAASNTANRSTEGFQRLEVERSAHTDGGVQARTVRTDQPNNTDAAAVRDAVEVGQAQREFEANAAAFRAREDALGSLFDERA